MKRIAIVSVFSLIVCALIAVPYGLSMQRGRGRGGPPPTPTNLQVLPEGVDIRMVMQNVAMALGVECTYCHVQGDFASDEMETKLVARTMMRMVQTINNDFLANLPEHEGEEEAPRATCVMCHRGSTHPLEDD